MVAVWDWLSFWLLFRWMRTSKLLPCQVQVASLIGHRKENQDNYLVINAKAATGYATARWLQDGKPHEAKRPKWPSRWTRLALLDGIGGHAKGREIAEAAAIQLRDLPPCTTIEKQRQAVLELHKHLQAIFTGGGGHTRSPGATLIWAEIDNYHRTCNLLHIGDSRAWLCSDGHWLRLTWDHSPLEFSFRDGRINLKEYIVQLEYPEHRIAQALGYGSWGIREDIDGNKTFGFTSELRIDTASSLPPQARDHVDMLTTKLIPGSMLLLASDGLWNATKARLPDPKAVTANTAQLLAQQAVDAGSQDNTTVVLAIFGSEQAA